MPPKRKSDKGANVTNSKKAKKGKAKEEETSSDTVYSLEISTDTDPCQTEHGVLFSGLPVGEAIARSKNPDILSMCMFSPHRLNGLNSVKITKVVSHCGAAHSILISSNYEVFVFGRNETGQLGIGKDGKGTDVRTPFKLNQSLFSNEKICDAAVGKGHTMFLTTGQEVFSCGDNSCGQLGIGASPTSISRPKKLNFSHPVKQVACGQMFTMFVEKNGLLFSCGNPEFGQLGNGTEGKQIGTNKYIWDYVFTPNLVSRFVMKGDNVKDTRVVEDVSIKQIACGNNHTIAVDTENRLFTWGCGGYGRLGHNSTPDEYYPRQNISFLHFKTCEITSVAAGSTYSLVTMAHKMTYFCGQTRMASNGAEMYFKAVMDLSGWDITCLGTSNKSILAVGGGQAIAWGPSPTSGEMALGDGSNGGTKVSKDPKLIPYLEGFKVKAVTCGHSFSFFIVDLSSDKPSGSPENAKEFEENVKKFNEFPMYCGYE